MHNIYIYHPLNVHHVIIYLNLKIIIAHFFLVNYQNSVTLETIKQINESMSFI